MNAGTTINAGSGTITMSAPGNIALTGLSTTNNSAAAVSVSSSAGAITDAGDTTTDITAAGAAAGTTLSAATGVGSAKALDTTVSTLVATKNGNWENVVLGKSGDLGGGRVLKKKKKTSARTISK